jgi:hypothetical protein
MVILQKLQLRPAPFPPAILSLDNEFRPTMKGRETSGACVITDASQPRFRRGVAAF